LKSTVLINDIFDSSFCFEIVQMYHYAGPPESNAPGIRAAYGQLYFIMDPKTVAQQRKGLPENADCDENLLTELGQLMLEINPYARAYKMMGDIVTEQREVAQLGGRAVCDIAMVFNTEGQDLRRYNVPTSNEVAAIVVSDGVDSDIATPNYMAVKLNSDKLVRLRTTDGHCDPMVYPILFPHGDMGYRISLKQTNGHNVSMLQFYAYRLFDRVDSFNPILFGGKLFHQYLVDSYVKIESNRLDYLRNHQLELRVDSYRSVQDYVVKSAAEKGLPPGRPIILPSTFIGGPRSQAAHYQDAMAICRRYLIK